ncbi:hypothetical protein [Chryseobacterium edaphi]|uniref:hypothetical protein n=1 Tax=Chryseobacterium edaphi TaxID=2976532 RepID=UPI003F607D4E
MIGKVIKHFSKFENLSKIAKLYNIDINDLISADKINNTDLVKGTEATEILLEVSEKLNKLVVVLEKLIEKK